MRSFGSVVQSTPASSARLSRSATREPSDARGRPSSPPGRLRASGRGETPSSLSSQAGDRWGMKLGDAGRVHPPKIPQNTCRHFLTSSPKHPPFHPPFCTLARPLRYRTAVLMMLFYRLKNKQHQTNSRCRSRSMKVRCIPQASPSSIPHGRAQRSSPKNPPQASPTVDRVKRRSKPSTLRLRASRPSWSAPP